MIVLELAFDDSPARLAARPAHRSRLAALHAAGVVVLAGPLGDSGALLVFRCDRSEVDRVMAADPYYTMPGVSVVSLREWVPVVG
jgi:uncharacterized protein YciI